MPSSRSVTIFLALLSGAGATSLRGQDARSRDEDILTLDAKLHFNAWLKEHGKQYDSAEELDARMNVWLENHGKKSRSVSGC